MHTCENCGNAYERAFEVRVNGGAHYFDCFECAINKLAPRCKTCGTVVLGHGVEAGGTIYCCVNCARRVGVQGLSDHV